MKWSDSSATLPGHQKNGVVVAYGLSMYLSNPSISALTGGTHVPTIRMPMQIDLDKWRKTPSAALEVAAENALTHA